MTPHWNTAAEARAQDRINSQGQTQEIFFHHIRVPRSGISGRIYDTVEASVGIMQEKKQLWADGAVGRLISIECAQQALLSSTSPQRGTVTNWTESVIGERWRSTCRPCTIGIRTSQRFPTASCVVLGLAAAENVLGRRSNFHGFLQIYISAYHPITKQPGLIEVVGRILSSFIVDLGSCSNVNMNEIFL